MSDFEKIIQETIKEHFEDDIELCKTISECHFIDKIIRPRTTSKTIGYFEAINTLYVLLDDYINVKNSGGISSKEITKKVKLRPFSKLAQNQSLTRRLYNKENPNLSPIVSKTKGIYKINESLMAVVIDNKSYDIAKLCKDIINKYINYKQSTLQELIQECNKHLNKSNKEAFDFLLDLLTNADAQKFEIISYCILKHYYIDKTCNIEIDGQKQSSKLHLHKMGRTNANDGGIDFLLKPIGTIFQVTKIESFNKLFQDIKKFNNLPITFVIQTNKDETSLKECIQQEALKNNYSKKEVENNLSLIEKIINTKELETYLKTIIYKGSKNEILKSIINQIEYEYYLQ